MFKRADLEKMATIVGGVLVGRTSADGLATRAGLYEGDIILKANGMPTPDLPSLVRARSMRPDSVTLELYRYGQRLTLEVTFETPRARDVMRRSLPFRPAAASLPFVARYQ
jgi:S1-C subfamily serine protease